MSKYQRERSKELMFLLGLCAVMGALLSSGCTQGGDNVAVAAPVTPFDNVTVANTASNPVPTTDVGVKEPVATAGSTLGMVTLYTVPAGKRLVIETVTSDNSAHIPQTGAVAFAKLIIQTNGVTVRHMVSVVPSGQTGAVALWSATHNVRLYADPSSLVQMTCEGVPVGGVSCLTTISGHLVDVS